MPFDATDAEARILIVDDDPSNLRLLEMLLEQAGYREVRSANGGQQALALCSSFEPALIVLDLHMPGTSGYEILEEIRHRNVGNVFVPVLVFTADSTPAARERALGLGASDFLTKPCDAFEILLRIRNFLQMHSLHRELSDRNGLLEEMVKDRTRELEKAQIEIVERLGLAGEYRDDDTGEHAKRVGDLAAQIALALGWDRERVEIIRLAARLHDLGKIGIPDQILQKPSRLTEEEFDVMRSHAALGAGILADSDVPVLQMAEVIALSHHEWFDGSGYPSGMAGEMIPQEGRIVAVADVFDALTNSRPYKRAWEVSAALDEIERLSGRQFDPKVVRTLREVIGFDEIAQAA